MADDGATASPVHAARSAAEFDQKCRAVLGRWVTDDVTEPLGNPTTVALFCGSGTNAVGALRKARRDVRVQTGLMAAQSAFIFVIMMLALFSERGQREDIGSNGWFVGLVVASLGLTGYGGYRFVRTFRGGSDDAVIRAVDAACADLDDLLGNAADLGESLARDGRVDDVAQVREILLSHLDWQGSGLRSVLEKNKIPTAKRLGDLASFTDMGLLRRADEIEERLAALAR